MTEKSEKLIEQAIEKGIEMAEKTGTFVIDQAPDLIIEFYQWHQILNLMIIGICLLVIGISAVLMRRWNKCEWDDDLDIVLGIIGAAATPLSLMFLIRSIIDYTKLVVAPKIYLLEYFAN